MNIEMFFDGNEDSGVLESIYQFRGPLEAYFKKKKYERQFPTIYIVYICLDAEVRFRKRLRYTKNNHLLSFDIILDPIEMVSLTHDQRVRVIIKKTIFDLDLILGKYEKKLGFQKNELIADLIRFCQSQKWY